jgi:ABC-type phosphate/phosphonate transport system substrate-binding protein
MADLRLTYYPDITQHRTPEAVRESVESFARAVGTKLSELMGTMHRIVVLDVVSVARQTEMIAEGLCEIGLIKPSAYVYAHRRNPRVLPAAVALRMINGKVGDMYYAQIYADRRTGIETIADLRDRCRGPREQRPSIGFGDPFSTANFLVPAALLIENGLHPFTRFRRIEFLGGHDGVVRGVFEGAVDVGAGHDGVIVDLARQPGTADAELVLVELARREIHSDPVAVNVEDDAVRERLTRALLAVAEREEVKADLDIFWGAVKGLGPTRHENYASIEAAIDSLGIPESDVLGL